MTIRVLINTHQGIHVHTNIVLLALARSFILDNTLIVELHAVHYGQWSKHTYSTNILSKLESRQNSLASISCIGNWCFFKRIVYRTFTCAQMFVELLQYLYFPNANVYIYIHIHSLFVLLKVPFLCYNRSLSWGYRLSFGKRTFAILNLKHIWIVCIFFVWKETELF